MTDFNPYAPPTAEVADVQPPVQASPPLWNPNAAASWSLLLTPVFGSVVQMKNWQALGETRRAAASKAWAIGSLAFFVVMAVVGGLLADSRALDAVTRLLGFLLLIVWYYANGKSQQAYVLGKFGTGYPRKGWGKPLLLAVLALVGFIVAMGLLGFLVDTVTG